MKNILNLFVVLTLILSLITYKYMNNKKDDEEYNAYTSLVFSTKDGVLIPVSVPYNSSKDFEMDMRNRFVLMQSEEYKDLGLYPVFSKELNLNYSYIENNILYIDFNDAFDFTHSIDLLEITSYLVHDITEVKDVKLTINGKESDVKYNMSEDNKSKLGLNNFINFTDNITHSLSATCYKYETINNHDYYVPYTLRLSDKLELNDNIIQLLSHIDPRIQIEQLNLKDGCLSVHLSSHILLDNEQIDKQLENCIYLSALSFDNINDIIIYINNEEISRYNHKEILINSIE